jgi:hypothetical protein
MAMTDNQLKQKPGMMLMLLCFRKVEDTRDVLDMHTCFLPSHPHNNSNGLTTDELPS